MFSAILIWFIGMMFCYGFHIAELKEPNNTFKAKLLLALSREIWFAWPFYLGRTLRELLDKENRDS